MVQPGLGLHCPEAGWVGARGHVARPGSTAFSLPSPSSLKVPAEQLSGCILGIIQHFCHLPLARFHQCSSSWAHLQEILYLPK